MKLWKRIHPVLVLALALPAVTSALDLPKIVSADWLEKNGSDPAVRIVDIRKPEEFKVGHVPNAINLFYGSWAVKRNNLDNQLPEDEDLADLVQSAGIEKATPVVIVGKADTTTDQVNATRVAWTLRYAGVAQVGVLDGGINKWSADKKPVSTDAGKVEAAKGKMSANRQFLASKADVTAKLGKAILVDTRLPEFFFGTAKLPIVAREGRIPQSVNLPSAWIFTKEGSFKTREDLEAMFAGVVGKDKSAEIITFCDTGRLCSGGWYVLSEVLGYQNVKVYDGSMQEWAADANAPMVKYSWK
jgi:thiosulfate/3-mercaptopyruvate sulfurtransferase